MQALRVIQNVSEDGYLHVAVPKMMSRRCEVIVLPLDDLQETITAPYDLARLQEQSGFVQQVLAAESEDVWNDL